MRRPTSAPTSPRSRPRRWLKVGRRTGINMKFVNVWIDSTRNPRCESRRSGTRPSCPWTSALSLPPLAVMKSPSPSPSPLLARTHLHVAARHLRNGGMDLRAQPGMAGEATVLHGPNVHTRPDARAHHGTAQPYLVLPSLPLPLCTRSHRAFSQCTFSARNPNNWQTYCLPATISSDTARGE